MVGGGSGVKATPIAAVASADALPATANERDIAIISTVPVGNVYAQADQPVGEPGDVWLVAEANGAFSYVVGGATIQFSNAMQYSGSWEKVGVYQYAGGKWVSASKYLLDGSADTGTAWSTYYAYGGRAAKESTGYKITGANGGNQPAAIQTSSKVNLTGYSKLCCRGKNDNDMKGNFPFEFRIQAGKAYSSDNSYDGIYVITNNSVAGTSVYGAGEFNVSIDISKYQSSYYIGASSGHESTHIYEIWLEV
jgi:hypothetical protein